MKLNAIKYDPTITSIDVHIRPGKIITKHPPKRPRFFENDSSQWLKNDHVPEKDSFAKRVYAAEQAFADRVEHTRFADISEAAKYLRRFMEKAWFQRRFPEFKECTVTFHPRSSNCYAETMSLTPQGESCKGHIELSKWGLGLKPGRGGEIVLLHELAHCVLPVCHLHDRRWAKTYIEFIGCAMGQLTKHILVEEFKKHRIPMNPVRAFKGTPEQRMRIAAAKPGVRP